MSHSLTQSGITHTAKQMDRNRLFQDTSFEERDEISVMNETIM